MQEKPPLREHEGEAQTNQPSNEFDCKAIPHGPSRQKPRLRVLIVSPDVMTGEFLTGTLDRMDGNVKVTVLIGTTQNVVDQLGAHKPQVALISEELQDGPRAGFKVLQKLRLVHHNAAPIMLLKNSNPESVLDAFRGGARGIFYRNHSSAALPKCIRTVHQGQIWLSNEDLEYVMLGLCQTKQIQFSATDGSPLLTRREEDVVRLLVDGMKNHDIAKALKVSEHSVRNYLYRVFDKLGVSSRVELILYAFSQRDRNSAKTETNQFTVSSSGLRGSGEKNLAPKLG